MEARPNRLTPEMKMVVGMELAKELADAGHIEASEVESLAADIAKWANPHLDGYKIAKKLDDRYWDCNLDMAEILDGFSTSADKLIKAAEIEWAERNNIQPPLPVGSRVTAKWGGETILGNIDRIYEYQPAKYCVKRDGETGTSMAIVNFEDVSEAA